jgi:hemerythrin
MRRFRWGKDNEVFLAQVDSEHRELYRIAGELEGAIERAVPRAQIKDLLRHLIKEAEEHFQHEEWLMQSVGYPSYGWHKEQHNTARRRIKLFVPLIEAGEHEAADLFFEFLSGWMHDHTSVTDRMMASFIRNYERTHHVNTLEEWSRKLVVEEPA